jgi:Holliday junction resolvase RusA-like endonuclease
VWYDPRIEFLGAIAMGWVPFFSIEIVGNPQTAGSKRSFVPVHPVTKQPYRNKKTGGIVTAVVDDNPKSTDWKALVARQVSEKFRLEPLDEACALRLIFFRVRPASHFNAKGDLKPSAPPFPASVPDSVKLTRAVEDAMTKIVWKNDSRIVDHVIKKRWGPRPGVKVEVFRWNPETLQDRRAEILARKGIL